jgi:Na+-transporting methylmalonyl-CoA/oxaloacetate decarboxylase gamma subunit
MSKTKLLIWAVMLAVPGGVGLWTVQSYENLHEQQVRLWRPQVQEVTEQYLDSYRKWVALSYDDKAGSPWGHGEYGGSEIQQKLQQDQDKRLIVDIAELANGTKAIPLELACLMYGADWQEKVEDYQHDRRVCNAINILSSACIVVGMLLFITIGIIWLVGTVVHTKTNKQNDKQKKKEKEPAVEPSAGSSGSVKEAALLSPKKKKDKEQEQSTINTGYFESLRQRSKVGAATETNPSATPAANATLTQFASIVSEAEPVSMMTPEPVLNSLTELTEEVSAIRQYAAQQQDQMRKLQDGYDWMLIRRFCMRIIRCIDNISDRIEKYNSQSQDSNPHTLEDIRDELTYALESSGVEPFSPDLGAAYKGLERYAEAVHERCTNNDPDQSGTIAKIIRPGYQYLISESEIKVVRCAQVQLYE